MTDAVRREFDPARVVQLAPGIRRITAPNPSMMTGPGTNCYLVGEAQIVAIDPGIDDGDHVARIAAACDGQLRWIVVTHTHPDHSPAAARLARLTGARVLASPVALTGIRDEAFRADGHLADGDLVGEGPFQLRVLHTPGHAANHLCYLLPGPGWLFAGDHVMDGATVVIAPPDGDMGHYLDSLQRLLKEPVSVIAPAHGRPLREPQQVVRGIIDHRLARERSVLQTLAALGRASAPELVARIYTDVPEALHAMAARSVTAHLLKLAADGRVALVDGADGLSRREPGPSEPLWHLVDAV